MNVELVRGVSLAWVPVVAILFRLIGPRPAVLVGLLGGSFFLPAGYTEVGLWGYPFPVNRWNMTGLALLSGVVVFDFRTLLRFRPSWFDLPMVLYAVSPLVGLITGVPGSGGDILDALIIRGLGWIVPYLMGRLYFGQGDGPSLVGRAFVISGLIYVPLCIYEEIVGPTRYLGVLIYGIPYKPGMVDRLGGWRPEVFLNEGIVVATWMALTTVLATWIWLGGTWRTRWFPAWLPALVLLATTLSCRGIYGYLSLAIGLGMVVSTWAIRSRAILIFLAVIPFAYMTSRASGLWDGSALVEAARFTGREGTIDYRLKAEDEVIRKVLEDHPFFGFGNYVWHGGLDRFPDGSWLQALWFVGLVGLLIQLISLYVLPLTLALSIPQARPSRKQAMSTPWALAGLCVLLMIDSIHNVSYFNILALIGGTIIGAFLSRNDVLVQAPPVHGDPPTSRLTLNPTLWVVVIVLIAIEIMGRLPRQPVPKTPASVTPSAAPNPLSP